MAKRQHVQKLLAVMVMATAPAAADSARIPPVTALALEAQPRTQPASVDVARAMAVFGLIVPRKLVSGAPACGNVMSKRGHVERDCDEDDN